MAEAVDSSPIPQSPAQTALATWIEKQYKAESRSRWAEEREWATAGYFDQLKQWLEEDESSRRLAPVKKNKSQKWPMPVTNLFSKAINSSANALGADIPRMTATSDNYDARNRRAAEAAERVIDEANRESDMGVLTPRLAKNVVLFGMGCVYDTIAFDRSTVEVPEVSEPAMPAAGDGQGAGPSGDGGAGNGGVQQPNQVGSDGQEQGGVGGGVDEQQPQVSSVMTVPTARLKSYILTPFEYILPRDAQDANLATWRIVRWRRPLGQVKELYPEVGEKITGDNEATALAHFYLNTLRSLSYQNEKTNESDREYCTLTIFEANWTELPDDVQDKIEAEWGEPSQIYQEQGFTKAQAAIEYGITCVLWNGSILQWSENWLDGDSQLTFFPWQKDCVSVYPKGLSVELIPLTKKLNRIDSLIEREAMSSGTGKWLIPTTQTVTIPSGDPQETMAWDPLGDGKVKPEYFPGNTNGRLIQYRETIVADIEKLSFDNSVAEGEMPAAGTAFRALAFLGSKAEETRKTQRFLWEQAHELRARKLLKMAKKVWTEPRKVKTAGFNNRYGAMELDVADIDNGSTIEVVQDSSRPKTLTEKLQAFQMAQAGGLINPADPETREYAMEVLGLQDVSPTDHLMYEKAARDLEKLKKGIQPMESPFEKWDICLKVFADYTLTEEFEELDDLARNGILMYTQYISQKLSVAQGAPLGAPPPPPMMPPPADGKAGIGGQSPSHIMHQVPGSQVSAQQVQGAALREAANVVPNAPSPTA